MISTRPIAHKAASKKKKEKKLGDKCEPVWPSGKELGWQAGRPQFDPFRLCFLSKNGGLWTLSRDFAHTINETLKCLTQLPALVQSHSGGDSVASLW